jgi:23S rRNA (adenine2030-N6)-methyltransferase
MNYLHHYHAGNFADVFKHLILLELVSFMQRKDTPLAMFDTHAGAGMYDLTATPSQKTGEWKGGIGKLWGSTDPDWQPLLSIVKDLNGESNKLSYYPGSPLLMAEHLRIVDTLTLCETSDGPMKHLRENFGDNRRVHIHQRDGYEALIALLPPKEAKRALVHIDPPFEQNDYARLYDTIPKALHRFRQGVFAIWYPVKTRASALPFVNKMRALVNDDEKVLNLQIMTGLENTLAMNGTGMLIINPPFGFEAHIKKKMVKLEKTLKQD